MKTIRLILCLCLFTFWGCEKEEVVDSCIKDTLEEFEMVLYDGQEIGCHMTLSLFEYKKEDYFMLDNYCADMIAVPIIDCEGNQLCRPEDSETQCQDFYENAVFIKTIGISL